MTFLQDKTFLMKLNESHITTYMASIAVLNFETEKIIAKLEGKIISGNMTVAANSSVRRTGSFNILAEHELMNITEVSNLIAIDKKISFSIGIKNPFYYDPKYKEYGEELWFEQGIFFITGANTSVSTGGLKLSINLIDKMGGLNGVCGGTLPATVSFHEIVQVNEDSTQIVENPIIKDIIYEAVSHFGGEHPSRIIIQDVPDTGRQIVEYMGSTPIWIQDIPSTSLGIKGRNLKIQNGEVSGYTPYYKGNYIGYMSTPLTYPGELVFKAGSTVTQVLDQIVKTLGNYEYFYDTAGNFIFRQIRNFQATGQTPLNFDDYSNISSTDFQNYYIPRYTDYQFFNEFSNSKLINSISFSPKFDNIKNDFICWGTKNDNSKSSNVALMVRYHLAIDEKPVDEGEEALCRKAIFKIVDINTGLTIRYSLTKDVNEGEMVDVKFKCSSLKNLIPEEYSFNWREELYRKALLAYGTSTKGSDYDEELLAEWRLLFDVDNMKYKQDWINNYGNNDPWYGYNPQVRIAPNKIRYWLDIIDSSSELGKYSVKKIGRRSKIVENSKINEVFSPVVNDLLFFNNPEDTELLNHLIAEAVKIGQDFSIINSTIESYFTYVNSYGSCFEEVRAMLDTNLLYNTTMSISCIPVFYLDVNCVVRINVPDLKVNKDFIINNISWQIGQNMGNMSLSLNEAITII